MKYRFIDEHRRQWPVRLMCRVLQVCPGGYYTWRDRPARAQQQRREALTNEMQAIHQEGNERFADQGGICQYGRRGKVWSAAG